MQLIKFQEKIRKDLEKHISKVKKDLLELNTDKNLEPIFNHLPELFKGGKNLRPYLAWLVISKNKEVDWKKFSPILMAIEILHVFALVHDDVIDKADTRRGVKTIQKIAVDKNNLTYSDSHYGNSQAIIIGDILLAEACFLITKFDTENNTKVHQTFQKMIKELCYGQMIDVSLSYLEPLAVKKENVIEIMQYKTANYSLYYPLVFGYLAINEKIPSKLKNFSSEIGLAFQAQDDFLDVFGNQEKTGKPVGQDIAEGKHTMLSTILLENHPKIAKDFFTKYWRNNSDTDANTEWKNILQSTGTVDLVKDFINKKYETGLKISSSIWKDSRTLPYLNGLLEYLKNRNT